MSKENNENKKQKFERVKRKKVRKYSYINAIDDILDRYFAVYQKLSDHSEGNISGLMYDQINRLLIEDYQNSINNLEELSKKSMKYMKKRDSQERSKIFWYRFRRLFGFKKNPEIEDLIEKREQYKFEMAKLFEDLVSAGIREKVEFVEPDIDNSVDDEPDFVKDPKDLFEGPNENRSLHGEVISQQELLESQGVLSQELSLGYEKKEQ